MPKPYSYLCLACLKLHLYQYIAKFCMDETLKYYLSTPPGCIAHILVYYKFLLDEKRYILYTKGFCM